MIRPMTEDDLDAVVYIEYSATNFPWGRQQFLDSLNAGHRCTVMQSDEGVAGFAIFSSVIDEATLLDIAVALPAQKQGVGRALLRDGLRELQQQNVAYCFLEVRASNKPAQALYQTQGFKAVGRRKQYYQTRDGREDAIVMKLELSKGEC
jgi:ribosomal-protein-alanine N-acetyltransferase